jgi:hypothetical protein
METIVTLDRDDFTFDSENTSKFDWVLSALGYPESEWGQVDRIELLVQTWKIEI